MPLTAAAAVALAALLDRLLAEPPAAVHPVALFGGLVDRLDRPWPAPRAAGTALAAGLPLFAGAAGGGAVLVAARLPHAPGVRVAAATLAAGLVLFSTASLRLLLSSARAVVADAGADTGDARERLPALVGRDPGALSPGEIRSAAVESAAENLADGLVAPLGAFALVAGVAGAASALPPATVLALAAGAAAWVKAVNTLDSMLGYPGRPLGWAPARLDDLVMWLPARASALLLAVAAGDPRALSRARGAAAAPASPNAGWPMATLASALGVRLSKPGHYALDGGADLPDRADAERGLRVVARAGWLAVASAGVLAWP